MLHTINKDVLYYQDHSLSNSKKSTNRNKKEGYDAYYKNHTLRWRVGRLCLLVFTYPCFCLKNKREVWKAQVETGREVIFVKKSSQQ